MDWIEVYYLWSFLQLLSQEYETQRNGLTKDNSQDELLPKTEEWRNKMAGCADSKIHQRRTSWQSNGFTCPFIHSTYILWTLACARYWVCQWGETHGLVLSFYFHSHLAQIELCFCAFHQRFWNSHFVFLLLSTSDLQKAEGQSYSYNYIETSILCSGNDRGPGVKDSNIFIFLVLNRVIR